MHPAMEDVGMSDVWTNVAPGRDSASTSRGGIGGVLISLTGVICRSRISLSMSGAKVNDARETGAMVRGAPEQPLTKPGNRCVLRVRRL